METQFYTVQYCYYIATDVRSGFRRPWTAFGGNTMLTRATVAGALIALGFVIHLLATSP